MRVFSAFAAAAFLAASPCMAQVGDNDTARHEYRAEQQKHAAQRDEHRAREDAAMGDRYDAAREHAEAMQHQAAAQRQEHRARQDEDMDR